MIKRVFHFIILFFIAAALAGCNGKRDTSTYFGGKIINPKTKFVVLHTMDKVLDTIFLDKKNKFIGKYDKFDEGLYYFEHANENQFIYLEPNDSLMLRLNTWDFDESLVFAGKGAERNNILIDIFLEDERDNRSFYKLNALESTAYKSKIDSILEFKLATYLKYTEEHPYETENYFKILKVALTYPLFAQLEKYPVNHYFSSGHKRYPKVASSFYNYRVDLDYNNKDLMYYKPYARYVQNFLYNTTFALGHEPVKNDFSVEFTVDLLHTINSEISYENSKNTLLKATILDHFFKKSTCSVHLKTFNTYFELSTNEEDIALVRKLLENNKSINKGDAIRDFTIQDFTDRAINIEDFLINKNSVLLFWNDKYISKEFISSRIPYLMVKFPNINFAIIEIDGNSNNRITNIDIKNQYFINSQSLKDNFLSSKLHRTILVDKNGIVNNGYASISSPKLYSQLEHLSKTN